MNQDNKVLFLMKVTFLQHLVIHNLCFNVDMGFFEEACFWGVFSRIYFNRLKIIQWRWNKVAINCQLQFKIEAYSFNAVYFSIEKLFKGLVTINISY